ncbi:hypothetical protein A9Q83_11810 [Alphaproteobacteria bacterium 46_93_T64]|nr:hypothetical protein A9Q83_11810 [Alphaproteobacteria bacterium 46_93_T64]
MTPRHAYVQSIDLSLSYYEWGNADDPVILLVHATGMHGRVWDACIKALPVGYRIIALEIRGHGLSRYDGHLLNWELMGNDVKTIIQTLDLNNIIGVGHSMGGHALTQACLDMPDRFKRLLLIDPVIFSPERYDVVSEFEKGHPKDNPISRRRSEFNDWHDMVKVFEGKPPYSNWKPEVLEDYCQFGVKDAQNGVTLACIPETEASVYMGHCSVNLISRFPEFDLPVTVLRARQPEKQKGNRIDFSASPTWPDLAAQITNAKDVYLPELSHFIPMEDPELTAKYILEEI